MRIYLFILSGLISALMGWNIAHIILSDLELLRDWAEIVLFPCVAIALSIGLIANEIFISTPTRPKLNFRVIKIPLLLALALGLLIGLGVGALVEALSIPELPIPSRLIRVGGWVAVGAGVGLAEGLTWRWRSVEVSKRSRQNGRIVASVVAAVLAGLVTAMVFELLREYLLPLFSAEFNQAFRRYEDPVGIALLGGALGFVLSITSSPSYRVALRAGTGFEYSRLDIPDDPSLQLHPDAIQYPYIASPSLELIGGDDPRKIEEGLSIQLPSSGTIRIGSAIRKTPDIYIPNLPLHVADLVLQHRTAFLEPNARFFHTIEVNGRPLKNRKPVPLKHNYVLTFRSNDPQKDDSTTRTPLYRFVYYNRFLDPQA